MSAYSGNDIHSPEQRGEDDAEAFNAWAEDYADNKLANVWPDPKTLADELARVFEDRCADMLAGMIVTLQIAEHLKATDAAKALAMSHAPSYIHDRLRARYLTEATPEAYAAHLRHERAKYED